MAESADVQQSRHPTDVLLEKAAALGCRPEDQAFAVAMDTEDPLRGLREDFHIPKMKDLPPTDPTLVCADDDCVYMCGNSLGLQPKGVRKYLEQDLDYWARYGVFGHFEGPRPWALCDEYVTEQSARIVGARPEEVACMNGLTVNLHLLLVSFYRPTSTRHKILIEGKAFPSDHYAMESQIRFHGYDPATSLLLAEPRPGEQTLRTEDLVSLIKREGDAIAAIVFSGVQYYTGQLFDMETITRAGHSKGCVVGFDLAHAVGNAELHLHDWGVDFACWCTYKYMNSGAGGLAGAFVHEKHAAADMPKLLGWWGHKMSTRFRMDNKLDLSPGVNGLRVSNPPPLLVSPLLASLDVFQKTTMADLRRKSVLLTGYLEFLIKKFYPKPAGSEMKPAASEPKAASEAAIRPWVEIITPSDPAQRGCQLSLMFSVPIGAVFTELERRGVACDKREPNVLRIAPAPLYNSFSDVHRFVSLLGQSLQAAQL
ncbi:kynureninase-like isoform X1 [Branchiostoma floridae]|uniref:Kynureninase n=2 Tax=Branchiostoma floridae TaxID=7739 RepID=A0A9J7MUV8_BRAFL|nr:kynureninase-like isoform X1 [Branchiostoma floridae]XP_035679776.1 kynureninase-like isoform X1 [Branchiostoma floridae]XP_035679778.1 kynureninase-like isoform X1 [Branchiostoma floridae]